MPRNLYVCLALAISLLNLPIPLAQAIENPLIQSSDQSSNASRLETAILSGGCFWGMEEVFRKVPGVIATEVGYTGGLKQKPSYEEVSQGDTGHAESIRIQFDPHKMSYEDLLKIFFRAHNPTTLNRQSNDRGTQYRSAIFAVTPEQAKIAEKVIQKVNATKKWDSPIVTKVQKAMTFFPAEEYHQKYLIKNPHGYNDHFLRDFEFIW